MSKAQDWTDAAGPNFKINTHVDGTIARGLRSREIAQARYMESAAGSIEAFREDLGHEPPIEFKLSTEHPDGDCFAVTEHVQCWFDGNLDACIWTEQPAWPAHHDPLTMSPATKLAVQSTLPTPLVGGCAHHRLLMSDVVEADGTRRPLVTCVECPQTWTPAVLP